MAKISKTWNLGEHSEGGVITVEITDDQIAIIGKEWDPNNEVIIVYNKNNKINKNRQTSKKITTCTKHFTHNKKQKMKIYTALDM